MAIRRIGMECCSCGLKFSGEGAFNKHRTGSYGANNGVTGYKHERRCLTVDEMKAKDMAQNGKGLWTTATPDEEMAEEKEEVEA